MLPLQGGVRNVLASRCWACYAVPDEIYRAMQPTLVVDGDLWLMSTPGTDCPRISQRVLGEEKATAGDRWYRQEYLCEFVDREGLCFRGT
jgi:hypothetical protein